MLIDLMIVVAIGRVCASHRFRSVVDRTEFTNPTRGRHTAGPRSAACLTRSSFGAGAGYMCRAIRSPASLIRESLKFAATSVASGVMTAVRVCGCGSCCPIAAAKLPASNLPKRCLGRVGWCRLASQSMQQRHAHFARSRSLGNWKVRCVDAAIRIAPGLVRHAYLRSRTHGALPDTTSAAS
jgi:hypothetical protein